MFRNNKKIKLIIFVVFILFISSFLYADFRNFVEQKLSTVKINAILQETQNNVTETESIKNQEKLDQKNTKQFTEQKANPGLLVESEKKIQEIPSPLNQNLSNKNSDLSNISIPRNVTNIEQIATDQAGKIIKDQIASASGNSSILGIDTSKLPMTLNKEDWQQVAITEANKNINEQATKSLKYFFSTAQTNIGINNDKKVEGSIIGFRPILPYDKTSDKMYGWQTSFATTDSRYTFNNGLVYRKLTDINTYPIIYGANIFHDIEFPYQHQRASLGLELKSNFADLNYNHYEPLTKDIIGRHGLTESVMKGDTFDTTLPIPYLPRLKANIKYSQWYGNDGESDSKGMTYTLVGNITDNTTLTAYQKRNTGENKQVGWSLNYNYNIENKKTDLPIISDTPYEVTDLRDKMIEIVNRENIIKKQISGSKIVAR